MATQVRFEGFSSCDKSFQFRFVNGVAFEIKSYTNGIMVIDPGICNFNSLANAVAGCFEEGSNFNGMKAIEFEFNEAYISVTAKNADSDMIIQQYFKKLEENCTKYAKSMKTPEYRAMRAKFKYRREKIRKLIQYSVQTEELQFKNEEARKFWNDFVEISSKESGAVRFAESFAKFMQYLISKHKKLSFLPAASEAFYNVNTDETLFVCVGAVDVLSHVWKYGGELREWFNSQWFMEYVDEGDDTVNSNLLNCCAD